MQKEIEVYFLESVKVLDRDGKVEFKAEAGDVKMVEERRARAFMRRDKACYPSQKPEAPKALEDDGSAETLEDDKTQEKKPGKSKK